jgi:periplasmic mercuric ion binding protein
MKNYVAVAFILLALIASRMLTEAPDTAQIAATRSAAARTGAQPVVTNAQTATLRVGNMYCPSCPYIVQRALLSTPGVIEASVSLRDQLAVVRFDPAKAGIPDLVTALSAIGYPSRPESD